MASHKQSVIVKLVLLTSFMILGLYVFVTNDKASVIDSNIVVYAAINTTQSEHMNMDHSMPTNINMSAFNMMQINSSSTNNIIFDTLSEQDKPLLCGDNKVRYTSYVKEFITPILCSQPVGIAVDKDNNVWIASGKSGNLFVFNPSTEQFVETIRIPNWPEQNRNLGSMIWDMKFDNNGDLWFTDELSNSIWKYFTKEGKFENYRLLQEGGYPLSLTIDSDNNVWFTQVFGKRLGFLEPDKVINNTTKGISELDMSKQINFQTMGPISNGFNNTNTTGSIDNRDSRALWFSTAVFPVGGQIIKFDKVSQSLTIHDLNYTRSIPFSIAEDENGLLWANNHISNLFLWLDPNTGAVKQYATSNPSASGNLTTLPYINQYKDGKIWFNEHYGNAIASFDLKTNTLVEYYIPTHNPLWINSSNPLRFTFDNNGSVWFTEWTENKLGVIPTDQLKQLPISVEVSKNNITLDSVNKKGDSLEVSISSNLIDNQTKSINNTNNSNTSVAMSVTSSISKNGKLDNLTSSFNPSNVSIENIDSQQFKTVLKIDPKEGVNPGNYTLTITAKYGDEIAISKIVDMFVK